MEHIAQIKLLGPKEVAAVIGCSPRLAQILMSSGVIPSGRAGKKLLRTTPQALADYCRQLVAKN